VETDEEAKMSYEGHVQLWCENGHAFTEDANTNIPQERCSCGAEIVFRNSVDDTNCDSYGHIKPEVKVPAVVCTCSCCGDTHEKERAIHHIPTKTAQRYYRESEYVVVKRDPDGHEVEGKWVHTWVPIA
jgi:hypothetical protein